MHGWISEDPLPPVARGGVSPLARERFYFLSERDFQKSLRLEKDFDINSERVFFLSREKKIFLRSERD